jgi:phenylalanyl-tRNA synthetase beta chain
LPVVKLSIDRIERLTREYFTQDKLRSLLMRIKSETEFEDGYVYVEVNSDRPDLMVSEGIARALKGLLDKELGLPKYSYNNEDLKLIVDNVSTRPYIVMAVVRNVEGDEEFLRELIQFQEKIHATLGRGRRKAAIGIHDLSKVPGKKCVYRYVSIDHTMKPLHMGQRMSIKEVLRSTEQGVLYGEIALNKDLHPAILCDEEIISLPPVINSDLTKIDPDTRHLLIDVTGTDLNVVEKILEILTTTLAEGSRNRYIGRVIIRRGDEEDYYPKARVSYMNIEREYINRTIGIDLDIDVIKRSLERSRMSVEELDDNVLKVYIPSYRIDILHKIDLVEEIVISYGLENIGIEYVPSIRRGSLDKETVIMRQIRDLMNGFGYIEIMSFILTSKDLYQKIGFDEYVEVLNPVSKEFSVIRSSMIPSILNIMTYIQNQSKPVRIYEIGDIVISDDPADIRGLRTRRGLGIGLMDYETRFEEMHALVFSLIRLLGLEPRLKNNTDSNKWLRRSELLISGRRGFIYIDDKIIGVIGEIKPEILEALDLRYPVIVSEIDLTELTKIFFSSS